MRTQTKIDKKTVGFFRFKKHRRGYLLTNDYGNFARLNERQFSRFLGGALSPATPLYKELAGKYFIKNAASLPSQSSAYRNRCRYLLDGPTLHIVVVTARCNFKCVYCQANRRASTMLQYDMTKATARNVVDRIFESPSQALTIEFQGGEPLLNWPVVKFIIEYAEHKNRRCHKNVNVLMVTNLSLMTDAIYDYLIAHRVSVCTSLDGPADVHNTNRPFPGHNSHQMTANWIAKLRRKEHMRRDNVQRGYMPRLSALVTLTRHSLPHLKRIIDEYIKYDFRGIHLRRLSFLGLSGGDARNAFGYSAHEFIGAWKDAMEYIIGINLKGRVFAERQALIFLQKIFWAQDPGYLDLRSPCGAGVGQLAYDYNGKVYTCDEARMLGDDSFLLGDVNRVDYRRIAASPRIKSVLLSSTLENFTCDECVYKPYCGICPVTNYVLYGSIFPQINRTDNCKINTAMLDYIFDKLTDKKIGEVFRSWLKS